MTKRANGEGSIYPFRSGFAAYAWITTPAGTRQRKYVYGKTREEVHGKWIDLMQKATRGAVSTKVPTLEVYLDRWLSETVEPNLAPLTASTYESHVRNYIKPGIGGVRLDRLSVATVQAWLNRLPGRCQCCAHDRDRDRRRCCAIGKCCHACPSARTVKDVRTVLRSALSSAMREELVTRNVAALVKIPTPRKRKLVPWDSDEARKFLESARSEQDDFYAAFVLVLVMGMRKGEVLGLCWPEVDLEKGELGIDRQLQRVRRELLHRETKTEASEARLPTPDIVIAALELRRRLQARDRDDAGSAWRGLPEGPHLVFTGRFGTPIDPRTLNRRFTARCDAAGVRRMTVHDARRTCATLLVDLDVHPRIIMRILRHADLAVTMEIYAKASSKSTREALRRLSESLS